MRRVIAAMGMVCAVGAPAAAQFSVPGQPVGSTFNLPSAGKPVPKAAPQAGMPIGNPLVRPYDPTRPLDVFKGTDIDPSTVVAPVSGYPGIATQQPNLLERLYDKLSSVTSFFRPKMSTPVRTYTPGISRRNRERAQDRMWRRD